MALPRINETLNFTMSVPSTGKKVKYRPYLVKEEKVLLQAFESGDTRTCLEAMADTLNACIDPKSKIDVAELATFDIEYLFMKVRSKSVGENSNIVINCGECKEPNPVIIDLDSIEVEVGRGGNIIEVNDEISVEMKYPTYKALIDGELNLGDSEEQDMDTAMALLASSIEAVLTKEERIETSNLSTKEVVEFLSSMTTTQLQGVTQFLENMPAMKHEVEFDCKKCNHHNKLELKGLSDFF